MSNLLCTTKLISLKPTLMFLPRENHNKRYISTRLKNLLLKINARKVGHLMY